MTDTASISAGGKNSNSKNEGGLSQSELEDLVIESDSGARNPSGAAAFILVGAALVWSLFQLWIASPLPFMFGVFVLDETKARYIHLGFALFLAFMAYPALKTSPRKYIPYLDWAFAIVGSFSALYLFIFYDELAIRTGLPTQYDLIIALVGILLLLEATRRALGPPLMIVAIVFLFYTFAGSWEHMPDILQHAGQSHTKVASHQWLTTEGVFGIALGVSTSFVFLFVLFGALLEKAGAGNYFIKVAFSLLGHFRGGPAKAAVLSSGMTGLISGSSIANVVTTGTFTVPLMRKVGFTREKAGAVEVASSVNGQIMPPVMGAAAFLMVEYVGIPYTQVVKHAFIPALISYIALLYMVHLEAVKYDMKVLPRRTSKKLYQSFLTFGITMTSLVLLSYMIYYSVSWIKDLFGQNASFVLTLMLGAVYLALLWYQSQFPELEVDDPNKKVTKLPEAGPTIKAGLHFLLPIVVLVWCLMVERLSPGLSAFWATVFMMFILITQHPIKNVFRKAGKYKQAFKRGIIDLLDGLITGARNMIGIGVATAAAGIIVGTVSLTGVGQQLTELVELISGGSFILVLIFTAIICLILGMGLPTTANYIVVASLMAKVIEELGIQNGIIIPAIAIHLFVFYFGIMADVTPPVGLASFAAAAVSGGDPIRTGLQAFLYSTRTVILPFLFIFNTELLLIGVDSIWHGLGIFIIATVAILLFAAATQGYLIVHNKWFESIGLLAIAFTFFNPQFWVNQIVPPYVEDKASRIETALDNVTPGQTMKLIVSGEDLFGDPTTLVTFMKVPDGATGKEKLNNFGITNYTIDGERVVINTVAYSSGAQKAGLLFDFVIESINIPQEQPNKRLMYIPAIILLLVIIVWQRQRQMHRIVKA